MRKLNILLIILTLFMTACQKKEAIECVVLTIEDHLIEVAPSNYDKDVHESFKDEIQWMQISEQVTYHEIYKETIVHENGKKETTETKNQLTREQFEEIVDLGNAYVYLEFNNEQIITKITLHGELIVYE